jgi:hypothetical protein
MSAPCLQCRSGSPLDGEFVSQSQALEPRSVPGFSATLLGVYGHVLLNLRSDAPRGARGLPADQQALVARQLDEFAFSPIVGGGGLSPLGILGPLGWVAAAVGPAIALRRAGLSRVPSILIGLSAIFAVHSWPTGSPSLAFFLLGAGLAEFARSKRAIQSPRPL